MKKVLLPLLMFVAFAASAQQTLTFEEAFMITMRDNPRIWANEYEEQAAEAERKAAFGLRLPQVGVTGAYVHLEKDLGFNVNSVRDGAKNIFEDIASSGVAIPPQLAGYANSLFSRNWGLTLQEKDFAFVGGNVTLPLYIGGKINAANRAARISERTVKEQGEQTRGALMSELVERYYGLALANQAVKVRQQVVAAMERHLSDAQALEQNGVIARSERLYVEVKLAEAERDLMDAKLQAATTARALSNTLNTAGNFLPISYMFVLANLPSVEEFQKLALSNNPQLKQVALARELAQEGVNVQRSEFLPHVAALGAANLYKYNMNNHLPTWVVGAGVSFKIFDGLNSQYKYKAAKNTVRSVQSLQYKAQSDISILVDKLYNELQSYAERIPSLEKSLEFATEYLRVKDAAFREGISSSVDVIDAELNLASTRIERLQNAYNYDLALAKLLEAAGMSESFPVYARGSSSQPVRYE